MQSKHSVNEKKTTLDINFRKLLLFCTFVITTMTYLRAASEEMTEEAQSTATLALFSLFAGICETLEMYDHLFPKKAPDYQENKSENSLAKRTSASEEIGTEDKKTLILQCQSGLLKAGIFAVAAPLGLCAWAHKLQGDALAQSLGLSQKLWGLILATPALAKFCVVSIPHLANTLNGTREQFALSVTNNDMDKIPEKSIPPLKWWVMLAILVYLHLPEGRLIAAPLRSQLLEELAAFGFALAESVPHLNQLEQLPQNIAKMIKEAQSSSYLSLGLKGLAGLAGGLGSASEAILAAIVGSRGKATAWIAPLIEFVLGFAETQQHLVPNLQKLNQHNLFSIVSPDKDESSFCQEQKNQEYERVHHIACYNSW